MKKVKSIVSSHPVYENAIPLRIAYSLGKDAFTSSLHQLIGIQKKFSFNYNIKIDIQHLVKEKIKGIEISKKILKKNFWGYNRRCYSRDSQTYSTKINFQKKIYLIKKKNHSNCNS